MISHDLHYLPFFHWWSCIAMWLPMRICSSRPISLERWRHRKWRSFRQYCVKRFQSADDLMQPLGAMLATGMGYRDGYRAKPCRIKSWIKCEVAHLHNIAIIKHYSNSMYICYILGQVQRCSNLNYISIILAEATGRLGDGCWAPGRSWRRSSPLGGWLWSFNKVLIINIWGYEWIGCNWKNNMVGWWWLGLRPHLCPCL